MACPLLKADALTVRSGVPPSLNETVRVGVGLTVAVYVTIWLTVEGSAGEEVTVVV